jgi:hypothetical protein
MCMTNWENLKDKGSGFMWLIYYVGYVGFKVYYFEVSLIINIDSIKSFLYIVLCKNNISHTKYNNLAVNVPK